MNQSWSVKRLGRKKIEEKDKSNALPTLLGLGLTSLLEQITKLREFHLLIYYEGCI